MPIAIAGYFQEEHCYRRRKHVGERQSPLPNQLIKEVLRRLHDGHQGMSRCWERPKYLCGSGT